MSSEFRTIQEIVYDKLKQRIVSGFYKPGERLIAKELADEFQISRMPVREALTRLGSTGLVEVIPYRGAIVNKLTTEDYVEIFHIRSVLEGLAARLACTNLNEEDLTRMRVANQDIKAMIAENDIEFQKVNRIFHSTVWEKTKSERLKTLLADLYSEASQYRQMIVIQPDRMKEVYEEHKLLIEALTDKDPIRAEEIMRDHYENTLVWLKKFIQNSREKEL